MKSTRNLWWGSNLTRWGILNTRLKKIWGLLVLNIINGPDLSFIGNTREVEWMRQYVRDPDSLNPDATMPPYKRLRADELEQLVAYLKSLR